MLLRFSVIYWKRGEVALLLPWEGHRRSFRYLGGRAEVTFGGPPAHRAQEHPVQAPSPQPPKVHFGDPAQSGLAHLDVVDL